MSRHTSVPPQQPRTPQGHAPSRHARLFELLRHPQPVQASTTRLRKVAPQPQPQPQPAQGQAPAPTKEELRDLALKSLKNPEQATAAPRSDALPKTEPVPQPQPKQRGRLLFGRKQVHRHGLLNRMGRGLGT